MKQVYQGVLEKISGLQTDRGTMVVGGKLECLERQVEQEIVRRKSLGTHISHLLESQLQILQNESRSQNAMHKAFSPLLRECFRLLMLVSDNEASLWNKHVQQWYVSNPQSYTGLIRLHFLIFNLSMLYKCQRKVSVMLIYLILTYIRWLNPVTQKTLARHMIAFISIVIKSKKI